MPSALLDEALAPLRANPVGAAILLDVDGTLAPIVDDPAAARVPDATRELLQALVSTYGAVACVSGRRAADARALVAVDGIIYIGSHGGERIDLGSDVAVLDPRLLAGGRQVAEFRDTLDTQALAYADVWIEDKGPITVFHWRAALDDQAAHSVLRDVASRAQAAGLAVQWGRKVMELRPPVEIDKGVAVYKLLEELALSAALYAGDDVTDLDAFRALHAAPLAHAVCVGVASSEQPAELAEVADLLVDGIEGMAEVLAALVS